ncbi:MAG: Na+/H+ antiporter NhaC family protein [bacterium]
MNRESRVRLPHPLILLFIAVGVAAALTWILPAGDYTRRDDPVTRRSVVVAGTYHTVSRAPVGPFAAVVSVPRGFVDAAEVIAVVLIVGGAWVVVDKLGTLGRLVAALVGTFRRRGSIAIPVLSLFFATMGALENMQEEIIPLVPVLLLLGRGLGIDAVAVVGMSAGAAMIGSAFGPTNPFQAGIAMKIAQLPPTAAGALRITMFVVALALWIAWTMRYAATTRTEIGAENPDRPPPPTLSTKDILIFLLVVSPMAVYIYGSIALGWGLNELSAGFLIAGLAAGIWGGLGVEGTTLAYIEGMQSMLPAAMLVGVARSISVVLTDGHVIDTILQGLATPLGHTSATAAALLMIPAQAVVHVFVPSVSGQAVLTMPVFVPLSDLLGISRLVTVIAYQMGAGLAELLTPTNGALMAVLLAAGVPFQRWLRFAAVGVAIVVTVGIAGMVIAMTM